MTDFLTIWKSNIIEMNSFLVKLHVQSATLCNGNPCLRFLARWFIGYDEFHNHDVMGKLIIMVRNYGKINIVRSYERFHIEVYNTQELRFIESNLEVSQPVFCLHELRRTYEAIRKGRSKYSSF